VSDADTRAVERQLTAALSETAKRCEAPASAVSLNTGITGARLYLRPVDAMVMFSI